MTQISFFTEPDPPIAEMVLRGALFVVNHSGGKDSQAMYLILRELVPDEQLVVVHAHLPDVEWDGVREHIVGTIDHPYYECQAEKTFLGMVESRGFWPTPKYRQCTSDLKRGPLEKLIRLLATKYKRRIIVNCMGMRAEESPSRKKKPVWKRSGRNCTKNREWYEWLPVHHYTLSDVFGAISRRGQKPHWAYAAGMTRLSCCFCIMASKQDLVTAARLRPKLLDTYIALEEKIDHTFQQPTAKGERTWLRELRDHL